MSLSVLKAYVTVPRNLFEMRKTCIEQVADAIDDINSSSRFRLIRSSFSCPETASLDQT